MRVIPYALIVTSLVATIAARAEAGPFIGRFQGTGRSCYGTLAVQANTISWMTPFSQCKSVHYELVEQSKQKGQIRMTYRLTSRPRSCRYSVLALTHNGLAEDTGWEVTGYGSEQSYEADRSSGYRTKAEDMMSCSLIREQGK